MKVGIYSLFSIVFLFSCQTAQLEQEVIQEYSHWIGDIPYDAELDESNFQLCDSTSVVHRRNALTYEGGRAIVKERCLALFQYQEAFSSFSGYIMIRFLINCEGETGRFRVQTMEQDFSLKECPEELKGHLLEIVKTLKDWRPNYARDEEADFSKYLNFKMKNGQIENILH